MMSEDYVSFDAAKLLKEKGFNWDCEKTRFFTEPEWDQYSPDGAYAPTLQMAMKWLREEHNVQIGIIPANSTTKTWYYSISKNFAPLTQRFKEFSTYEEACEASIKYCLENLI